MIYVYRHQVCDRCMTECSPSSLEYKQQEPLLGGYQVIKTESGFERQGANEHLLQVLRQL